MSGNGIQNVSLRDHLVVILLDADGGPLRLRKIRSELRKRGVWASESAVIQTLKRDPERFVRVSWGLYSMRGIR